MNYTYIVKCGDGTYYTGWTNDIEKRMKAHNEGKGAKYTRGRGPLKLRYLEECPDHSAALRREIQIKRLPKAQKLALCDTTSKSLEEWNIDL